MLFDQYAPTIHHGDCLDVLRSDAIADTSVDLVLTSPPYAEQRSGTYGGIAPEKYSDWMCRGGRSLLPKLQFPGAWVLNPREHTEFGARHPYVMETVLTLMRSGWHLIDQYVWTKPNPMPGDWPTRLPNGWEWLVHVARCTTHLKFFPEAVEYGKTAAT